MPVVTGHPRRHRRVGVARRATSLLAAAALVVAMAVVGAVVVPAPADAAVRDPFNAVFNAQDNGAIALTGNSQLSCPTSATCTAARGGTGSTDNLNNNAWTMGFVDADTDPSTTNSTSADVALPAGSTVLYALLVWGGRKTAGTGGVAANTSTLDKVALRVPGGGYTTVTGTVYDPGLNTASDSGPFQGSLDVTALVQAAGNGTYWVGNISAATGADRYAGWSLVVAYRNPAAPLRDLRVFRGFADVTTAAGNDTVNIPISGFLAPAAGPVNASVGVVAWEGDRGITGDAVRLNGTTLSAATNPATNFFNSAIGDAGTPITTRAPNYLNSFGVDVTRVSANGVLPNGATSTTVNLTTTGDFFYPGIVTTQIDLFTPAFNPVSKTVSNLSGHTPTQAGDTLEYQISLTNTGQDPADNSVVTDPLPAGITFVPGSILVSANTGAAIGVMTDAAGDDIAEYLAGSRTVRLRAGTGATGTAGGTLGINSTISFRFRATLDRVSSGSTVTNTASLSYRARTIGKDYTFVGNSAPTAVAALADLQITKTSTPTVLAAGGQVTYTVTARNNGPTAAANAVITDTLPAGVGFLSAAPPAGSTCTVNGQVISCTTASIPNGASVVVPIVASVSPAAAVGTVTNTATVASDTADDVGTNDTAAAATQVTTSADVSLTKAVSTTPIAGGQVTYTLVATNNGPSNAAAVVVNDPIPAGQSVVSATSTTGTCTLPAGTPPTGTVSCAVGTLGPTGQATITVVVRIGANIPAGAVTNTATVSTATPDPNPANNSAQTPVAITTAADLGVTKTAAKNPAVAGTGQTYTITVTNNGPSDAQGVAVSDPAVTGLTARSASATQGTCTITGGAVACTLGTVTAGGQVLLTVGADVADDRIADLTNTASASSTTTDPSPGNNTAAVTVPVQASADLALTKSAAPGTVVFGQPVTYTLTTRNNGPSQATRATITDPLPAGLTFASSPDGCTVAAGTVTCPVGTLAVGASRTVAFTANTPAGGSGDVINTATVTATTPDPNTANNAATAALTSQAQADLSLTKTASANLVAGQQITYTLTTRNNGPSDATGVVISDTVPAGVGVVSAAGPGITCTTAAGTVSCPVGTLANGQSATVTITGTLAAGLSGSSTNTATVTSAVADPTPGNNTASSTSTIGAQADVAVTLALAAGQSPTVTAGTTVNYTLTVRNNGPSNAVGVVITGQVPPGLTPVVGSSGGACVVTDGTVTCDIDRLNGGPLAPGAVITIPLSAVVNASTPPGPVPGTAIVGSRTPDPVPGNNSSTATIQVTAAADLSISKTVTPKPLTAGAPASYAITVTNGGPSDAQNVTITDTLDPVLTGTTPTATTGACTISGQVVRCVVPTLPAGTSVTATIPVAVSPTAAGPITNTATVASPTDSTPGNNSGTISTPVQQQADLRLVKTASPEPAVAGAGVTYTLLLGNVGPSAASAVTLTDVLPAGLLVLPDGVSSNAGSCAANPARTRVDCDFGTLPVLAGSSRTVVIRALIPADAADGTSLINTATLASPTPDPTPADRTASATTTVTTSADLSISKAPVNDPPEAGSSQGYVVSVTNAGPSVARGVLVTDPLPPGLTFLSAQTSSGTCTFDTGTVTCTVGDVPPGQSPTIQINVAPDPGLGGSTLVNTAAVASAPATGSPTPDPDADNNTSSIGQPVAARSDITLLKQITSGPIVAGAPVSYLLTMSNGGPSNARNMVLTDAVPAGTSLVSATASDDGTCQPGAVVTCGWPLVPVGTKRTVALVVAVPPAAVVGSVITNTATVRSDSFDNNPATATATAAGPVTASADISAVKTVLSGSPVAGGQVRWQVLIANAGPSDAGAVVLDDTPPAGVTFTATSTGTGTCTLPAGVLHCTLGTVPVGGSVTVTVDGTLAPDFPDTTVTNSATAGSATPDPNPGNNTGTSSTSTTTSANLSIGKTSAAATFTAGQSAGWTISVGNAGPSIAQGGVVTDTLPVGLTGITAAVVGGGAPDCAITANPDTTSTITCPLPPVGLTTPVQISVGAVLAPGVVAPAVSNNAGVQATTPDPDPTDNQTAVTTTVTTSADVTLSKNGPGSVTAGNRITWNLRASNNGPSDAQGVVITDTLPAGVGAVTGVGPRGPCSTEGGAVTCNLGALSDGGTGDVTITGTVDPGLVGDLTNTSAVTSSTADPQPDNNTAASTSTVTSSADVSLAKVFTAGDSAVPGRAVSWSLTASNAGPSLARTVVITDDVPAAVTGVSAAVTTASDRTAVCTVTGNTVRCTADTVTPGQPLRITISGILPPEVTALTLDNTAALTASNDTTPDNNRATTSTPLVPTADLAIGKAITSGPPVAGDPVTFEVDVRNLGPSAAAAVQVTDQLPTEIEPATATVTTAIGSCSISVPGGGVTCDLGTLPPAGTATITITGRVSQSLGSQLANTATVASPTFDPAPGNNTSTAIGSINNSADLAVSKTGPPAVTAGGQVTWRVEVSNRGPSDASDVLLADTLPDGVTGATMTPDGAPTCADITACALGRIRTGTTVLLTVTGTLGSDYTQPTVSNEIRVSSPTPDPDGRNNQTSVSTPVTRSADLAVAKTVTPSPLVPGRTATYTVTVANNGPSDADASIATDPLPDGLSVPSAGVVPSQGSCRLLGRTVSCQLGTITGGGQVTITIPVAVDAGYTGTTLVNTASVTSPTPDPDPGNNTGADTTPVTGLSDLTLTKTGTTEAVAGEPVSWTLALVNAGPSTAQNVVVIDPLPAAVTGATVSSTHGSCAITGTVLNCGIGSLPPGDVARIQVFLTAAVDPGFTGTLLVNTATVTSPTAEPDPQPGSPDGRTSTATTTVTAAADLAVSKVPTTPTLTPGQTASWTVTVVNNGPSTARTVTLTDTVPAGLSAVTFTGPTGPLDCPAGVCPLGNLLPGPGNAVAVTVSGLLDPAYPDDSVANTAAVTSPTDDPIPGNNDTTSTVPVSPSADLQVTKTADRSALDPAVPGEPIVWTITATNNGPSTARTVTLADLLPAGVTDVRAAPTAGSCDTQIVCSIGDLAPGAEQAVTVTITATLPPDDTSTTIINTATLSSGTPDPNTGNNSATLTTPVSPIADLSIAKTGPTDPATAGTGIDWTITVTNNGPSLARGVTVTDPAPAGVTGLTGTAGTGSCDGGTCGLGDLPVGATVTISVTGTVEPDYTGPAVINTATVTATTPDPVTGNNTATTRTPVTSSAGLSIVKTVFPEPAVPGAPVTFTLTVANAGPSTARTVTILDSLPDGLSGPTVAATSGTCTITGGTAILCQADTLDPGNPLVVTITATLTADFPAGTLSNTATVAAATHDPDLNDNAASITVPTAPADLTVTKTVDAPQVAPGSPLTWTVSVTNNGPSTARNTAVEDTLPAGVTLNSTTVTGAADDCSGDPVVQCLLGDLPAGRTATVLIHTTVDPTTQGTLTNTAAATTPDESNPDDNVAQADTTVVAAADLSVSKTVSTPPTAGGTVSWTIQVHNTGPAAAPDVVLTDALPAGLGEPDLPDGCTLTGRTISCSIGELAVEDTATKIITAAVDAASRGTLSNTAVVSASPLDPNPGNNTSTITAPIRVTGTLSVTKTADRAQAHIGEPVVYTITAATTGPSAALGVTVQEALPDGGAVTAATTNQGSYDIASRIWTIGTLTAPAPAVLALTITYDRPGDTLNTVTAASPDAATPATASTPVTVLPAPTTPDTATPAPPAPPAPAPPGGPGPAGSTMPNTGLPADRIGLSGLGLLLIGLTLTVVAKRRRTP